MIQTFLKEMDREAVTTRKMLQRVPDEKYNWKPHEKSMTLIRLATHVAELPSWVSMALTTDELDFAHTPYQPGVIHNNNELINYFENALGDSRVHLAKATEDQLELPWVLRNGKEIYSKTTKAETIRMTFSQIIHHRAQLGVYLRLLEIPIPGSYGPSADDPGF
ncbi:MAG TPA: DinB family protein [Agriterribacter sp.]|nr:DinB family protein [Agriterribacter sp.]